MKHKMHFEIGQTWTLGRPTQQSTGLGRLATIVGVTDDGKRLNVRDEAGKEATVKYANLGSQLVDGVLMNMVTGKPAFVKKAKTTIGQEVKDAFAAFANYKADLGDTVSGGKARRLKTLRNKVESLATEAGLTFGEVEAALAS